MESLLIDFEQVLNNSATSFIGTNMQDKFHLRFLFAILARDVAGYETLLRNWMAAQPGVAE
jgi:hypothetical protein